MARDSRSRDRARPRVDYLATGGTIASVRRDETAGVTPGLTATDLAAAVPGIEKVADLRATQFLQVPSVALGVADVVRLRGELDARVADGAYGVVVSQGTDTIEETAFLLDLLWPHDAPVVVTGAMRSPSQPGGDGPANLLAAVQVAASAAARGAGVLVVLNDEIHAARFVRKMHTSSPAAFQSPLTGPIGWVSEGRPVLATRPATRVPLPVPTDGDAPPVALVRVGLGDDGRLLSALPGLGYRGVVLEGVGGGHVTPETVPLVAELTAQLPVVLASRVGTGDVLSETYGFPGSEIDLLQRGVVRAGALDGLKARLLLTVCLAAGYAREQIAATFAQVAMTAGPIVAPASES